MLALRKNIFRVVSWNTLCPPWDARYKTMPSTKLSGGIPDSRRISDVRDTICGWLNDGYVVATQEMFDDLVQMVVEKMQGRVVCHRGYNTHPKPHAPNQFGFFSLAESRTTFIPVGFSFDKCELTTRKLSAHYLGAATFKGLVGTSYSNGYVASLIESNLKNRVIRPPEELLDGEVQSDNFQCVLINAHVSWKTEDREAELNYLLGLTDTFLKDYPRVIICGDFNTSLRNITPYLQKRMGELGLTHEMTTTDNQITRPMSETEVDKPIDHFIVFERIGERTPGSRVFVEQYVLDKETVDKSDHLALCVHISARL